MSNVRIVHQKEIGLGRTGQDVLSSESFVKFLVTFLTDGSLRQLKGAPLSAFMCIALHEAVIAMFGAEPLILSDVQRLTGWSRHPLIDALDYLVEHSYLVELPSRGVRREKQYRVKSYAYFGSKDSAIKSAENALLEKQSAPNMHSTPSRRRLSTKFDLDKSSSTVLNAAQKILKDAGWFTVSNDLPDFEDEEHARAIADWIRENPLNKKSPASYARTCVLATPAWGKPSEKAKWFDGKKWTVHGTREHTEYIRENPGSFDCGCEEAYFGKEQA